MDQHYDLIVLGAGSGGLAAAKRAASYGANVAIVEGDRVGGTCVIRGCVPKKLLVYGAAFRQSIEEGPSFGVTFKDVSSDVGKLFDNVREEVDRLNELHKKMLENSGVDLFSGWGSFLGPNSISIKDSLGNKKVISSKNVLISVGGRPVRPSIPGADLGWVSDDMFMLKELPDHVVVVGAGFIACEFSCILKGLGVHVSQLVRGDTILRGFDHEIVSLLKEEMIKKGIDMLFGKSPTSIQGRPGELSLLTDDQSPICCGGVLFATGRRPFINDLKLHLAGVKEENGRILVDENQATNVEGVFAIGDVTDNINLTPVAIDEGRAFADSIYGKNPRVVDHSLVAKAVFSDPEIASVGLSEKDAIDIHGESGITTYVSVFKPMSQALLKQKCRCMLKIVVENKSDRIIGCHMVGEHASEIIQIASISLGMNATKNDFDKTMALHPTIAEEFVTMR